MNPRDLLNTNTFTKNPINILKTIDQPFPKRDNRNWDPILSNTVADVVKDRYRKYKKTALIIDSRDRDITLYPFPNNYRLSLDTQFNYIESISLKNIILNDTILTKTKIMWTLNPYMNINFSIEIPNGTYKDKDLEKIMSSYMSSMPDYNSNIQNITVNISSEKNTIKMINRINIPEILSVQVLTNISDDIFNTITPLSLYNGGIYVLVNYQFVNMNQPLIPTGLPNFELFNFNEFWNGNSAINEYKFIDVITINTTLYYRYLLIPRINGIPVFSNTPQNIIFSKPIAKYLESTGKTNFKTVCCDYPPLIGEAQEFAIIFNESPLTEVFQWKECDINFKYVLTNITEYNINRKCFNVDNHGVFHIEPYIYLKLSAPYYPSDTIAGNVALSQQSVSGSGNKKKSDIFARINMNGTVDTCKLKYTETPLEKLDELVVSFVDKNGFPVDIKCENSVVLKITEVIDVLRDTYIDSRHGEVNTIGVRH